jgi:hypothetical protein
MRHKTGGSYRPEVQSKIAELQSQKHSVKQKALFEGEN